MIELVKIIFQIVLLWIRKDSDPEERKKREEAKRLDEINQFGRALKEHRLRRIGALIDSELRKTNPEH